MANFTRAFVLFAALFVTIDAGLCPVLCLYADRAEHGSSGLPSQAASSSACGACSCGLAAANTELTCPPAPVAKPVAEFSAALPVFDPAFDIDHPPRRS